MAQKEQIPEGIGRLNREKTKRLSQESRHLFLYLLTNTHAQPCGLYYLTVTTVVEEMGLGKGIDGALGGFSRKIWSTTTKAGSKTEKGVATTFKHSIRAR